MQSAISSRRLSTSANLYLHKRSNRRKIVPGWNALQRFSYFLEQVMGRSCLSTGVLFDLRKDYKCAIRRAKRQCNCGWPHFRCSNSESFRSKISDLLNPSGVACDIQTTPLHLNQPFNSVMILFQFLSLKRWFRRVVISWAETSPMSLFFPCYCWSRHGYMPSAF